MRELTGLSIIMVGGMGAATALRVAAPGVNLGICSVDREGLASLEQQTAAKGAGVYTQYVDATDPAAVHAFMDECAEKFGGVDILINFLGLSLNGDLSKVDGPGYDLIMDVNVKGALFATQAFADHVDTEKGGLVISFGSMASKRPGGGNPVYAAAKSAVNTLSQTLAVQLKSKNICFTTMNPGPTDTTFFAGRMPSEKRVGFMHAEEIADVLEFIMKHGDRIVFHDVMFDSIAYFRR